MSDTIFCHVHGVEEDVPADVYRICGECHHVFATADDLIEADRRETQACGSIPIEPISADQIWICPECTHDF